MRRIVLISIIICFYLDSYSQNLFLKLIESNYNDGNVHLFAPGIISTDINESKVTLNKTGDLIIYSITSPPYKSSTLVEAKFDGFKWLPGKVLSFSGKHKDIDPYLTPDGNTLFFSSNRKIDSSSIRDDFNLWVSKRKCDGTWGDPVCLDSTINSVYNEFSPAIAAKGNLYFVSDRNNGVGDTDIYLSVFSDGAYNTPVILDTLINTVQSEESPFISHDETFILFKSYLKGDFGNGDIYVSYKDSLGRWQKPINLGDKVNSRRYDSSPFMSSDYKYLFFVSNRIISNSIDSSNIKTLSEAFTYYRHPFNGGTNIFIIKVHDIKALSQIDN